MTNTDSVSPPGEILQDIVDDRRQHAASFARLAGLPLGTVQFWLRRDRHYREGTR